MTPEQAEAASARILAPVSKWETEAREVAIGSRLDLFSAACLRIRTKEGGPLIRFPFNPIQLDYLKGLRKSYGINRPIDDFRGIRDAIVKPRQLGFSTLIAALFFHDGYRHPGRVSVILAHDKDIAEILLETYRTFWMHLPPQLREGLSLTADSKYEFELRFPGDQAIHPPSRFVIATEGGHQWRGGVIHNLHASEAAFYRDYMAFKGSYVQAVPASGNVLMETTANGQNEYYQEIMSALQGIGSYRVVFYEWFRHPEYKLGWDSTQHPITAEETLLMAKHGLSVEQIAWRRWKQRELGELFPQEYPETLEGAFLASGRPFFDATVVAAARKVAEELNTANPPKHPRNSWTIYEDPIPGEIYVLAADTSEGLDKGVVDPANPELGGTDYSAAYVLKASELKVVAAIHGRIPPVEYAKQLNDMGRMYRATVAPERNNHGHTVVASLEASFYPAMYRHLEYDAMGAKYLRPGWPTSVVTRPMMLDSLDTVIRANTLRCQDPRFWAECSTFQRNPNTGKPEALPRFHDDRVMAMAIAVHLCTLGRNAWGLENGPGVDPFGFPDGSVVEAKEPDPAVLYDQSVAFDYRSVTCGACASYKDGRCTLYRVMVQEKDPGCPAHYPAEAAL